VLGCYKRFKKDGENTYLKDYTEGEYFGELALLYNTQRAASIIAKTDAVLFSLDRETFNAIVRNAASMKRQTYESFLSKVDILQDIDPYERMQIADALTKIQIKAGEYIVRQVPCKNYYNLLQGEVGDKFYFLQEGTTIATKSMKGF